MPKMYPVAVTFLTTPNKLVLQFCGRQSTSLRTDIR